jgi:hypothetical protein
MRRVEGGTKEATWIPKTRLVPMVPPAATDGNSGSSDPVRLRVCLAENFGFYSGDPALLLRVLKTGPALVPFEHVSRDDHDAIGNAVSRLKLADLLRWQAVSGVTLAFTHRLKAD